MGEFFELEAVYIAIAVFALSITLFVTTRDFMPKGAFKKGMLWVGGVSSAMVGFHYYMTTSRMSEVESIFNAGEMLICENKMRRTISRSVLIAQKDGWSLDGHLFKNPDYERDFHTSRCVKWIGSQPQLEQEANEKAAVHEGNN
jgi:hypothetical protein